MSACRMAFSAPANRGQSVLASLFLSLPGSIVDYPVKERRRLLDLANGRLMADDAPNGYLAISGDAAAPGFVLALFRRPGAGPVIAVQRYDELTSRTSFLTRANGQWEDRSIDLVPDYSSQADYELPRKGTTILVKNNEGKVAAKLRLIGRKFQRD